MKKLLSTTILAGIIATAGFNTAFADVASTALPSLNSATNADVTTTTGNMNIQIQGGQGSVGTLNWASYNVGSDSTVNYEFTAHNQTALNKVAATGGLSQIYGKITDSGCQGCGYESTGKIILLNPNGVFFGTGANVDVNSLTVSTMDGSFNKDTNKLELNRTTASPYGIIVQDGAQIYGDKNVTFASDNVRLYNGSKITTNVGPNVGNDSFGKIKIVTADGVNFNYYNNGAVKAIDGVKAATDKMTINVNGQLASGQIDIRNYSSNADSEVNMNGAALKAVKAVSGNDGNIWLTASNKVVIDNSALETANASGAASKAGGNISIVADKKASVKGSTLKAVGDIEVISNKADAIADSSNLTASKNILIKAGNIASAQNNSTLAANNITIEGAKRAQVHESTLNAKNNINVNSDTDVWFSNANLKANKIVARAKNGNVTGSADLNNNQTELYAGKDIDVVLANVGNRQKGLVAEADKNVKIKTDGTLSVSRLVAKNGDMTLESDKVIAGLPYTSEAQIPGDEANRSYIYVRNGKFTSKAPFEVTNSDTLTDDGKYQIRHHITYDNGNEKILLINPRDYVAPVPPVEPTEQASDPSIDDSQAKMLNRLPRQPESYNTKNTVADTRTTFVDVFAAASQIEIEDDEEE